jgi:hypothetical protein
VDCPDNDNDMDVSVVVPDDHAMEEAVFYVYDGSQSRGLIFLVCG